MIANLLTKHPLPFLLGGTAAQTDTSRANLLPAIGKYVETLPAGFAAIPEERKDQLEQLALFIKARKSAGQAPKLLFICTHNSRRSHIGQIFATVAAAYYGIDGIQTFSGGTEVTACNPRAVSALERVGFTVENPGGNNPHYKVTYATNRPPIEAFSKMYSDATNPKEGFAAIMTCSQADQSCPLVSGAALRVPLHYEDPKAADGTPQETATYDARTRQIATEVFYLFSRVKL